MTWSRRLLAICQPVFFAWSAVLAMATEVVTSPEALLRPMVLAAAVALAVFGVVAAASRSWTLAALISSGLVLFNARQSAIGLALLALACWWLLVVGLRRARGAASPRATLPDFVVRVSGIFSVALFVVSAWGLYLDTSHRPVVSVPEYETTAVGGPNVYVMLLDGYPRADTLRQTFEIDNSRFISALEELDFDISDAARSNYNKTWLTLASMLNGTYIDRMLDLKAVPEDGSVHYRWLGELINRASILDAFRSRGYTIRTIPSPFTSTTLTSADDVVDIGGLTELEVRLISASPMATLLRTPVLDYLRAQQEGHVTRALSSAADLAERGTSPQLVFAHVHSPHTPFVLHPAGTEEAEPPGCQPTYCPFWNATIEELELDFMEYRNGLGLQIEELDRLVLEAVNRIVEADPDAYIVLMSDHGTRYSLKDPDEHFRILLAARAPGDETLYADDDSPVNVLRALLGSLGEDIRPLGYERWDTHWVRTLELDLAGGS